jgi:hypothetical protein
LITYCVKKIYVCRLFYFQKHDEKLREKPVEE